MLRTRADVDRNQDYPRFVLSVIASSDFAAASSLIPIFRVARPTSSSITVHCMRAQQYRYNIELVIPRYRLIIGAEAKFSPAGARYTSVSSVIYGLVPVKFTAVESWSALAISWFPRPKKKDGYTCNCRIARRLRYQWLIYSSIYVYNPVFR